MNLPPLHGATGFWDEIACLVLPATLIMGVALAVLRQDQAPPPGASSPGAPGDEATPDPDPERLDEAAPRSVAGAGGRAEQR